LLRSEQAALVASFLHRVFVAPNVRVMAAADLAEALEDELYALRQRLGEDAFPKPGLDYLNDWAAPDKGWLRKFYRPGTDEAQIGFHWLGNRLQAVLGDSGGAISHSREL
jgi:hypothetical protein